MQIADTLRAYRVSSHGIQTMPLKHRYCNAVLTLLIAIASPVFAQLAEKPFYLHDGDTVVFYGDSITEQRFYTQDVEVYVHTRFPQMHVRFFNAGVGGDRVTGGGAGPIDLRLSRDVFPLKPTVVTIMLGMNDGSYGPLTPEIESRYTQGYEHILISLQQNLPGVRITLLGPSPYDEVTRPENFPGGYNSTLVRFAQINRELAQKYNATFIDLNAPFVNSLKRGNAINPLATELLLPDRVHPEPLAHWFMASALLKGWNAPSLVSSTTINAKSMHATGATNSHVSDLTAAPGNSVGISWTELDDAVPLPLDDKNAANHFLHQITDIENDLDQQLLTVHELPPGNYQISIDNVSVGPFTADELAKGVNLADYNTPMRGQAYSASWLIRDREDAHYIRLRMLVSEMRTSSPSEPGASNLLQFEDQLQNQIYEAALPKPRKFSIAPYVAPQAAGHMLPGLGDSPADAGPLATDLSSAFKKKDVTKALRTVADWQLARVQQHYSLDWTFAALYAGFMAVPPAVNGNTYQDAMRQMGTQFNWQLGPRPEHADDHAVGQTYLELYRKSRDPAMLAPTQQRMDALIQRTDDPQKPLWWWCDALFMAPPVLADLSKITGNRSYLDFMNREWWITSTLLYDPQQHLYSRDASYLDKHEANSAKVFWSRGNGWVMGGLARVLTVMPKDYPDRPRYVAQFQQMAAALAAIQGSDGLWRPGLLNAAAYPLPEVSGSAFNTYAIAWGIHAGILDRKQYLPVVQRAWAGLLTHVYQDGRLGSIQPIGAAPDKFTATSSYVFGVGAFLLAGSEIYELSGN